MSWIENYSVYPREPPKTILKVIFWKTVCLELPISIFKGDLKVSHSHEIENTMLIFLSDISSQ